jgi:dethiobiotin synthetase/adenosylmethionine--8-amino-7-oxononanoate aminotransferase
MYATSTFSIGPAVDAKQIPSDEEILGATHGALRAQALAGAGAAIVETAGGVLSPAPSGSSQADLYRPLRLPALLVGDHHLGGIATTVSAYESLRLRGYDVWLHVVFQEPEYMNVEYLSRYFAERGVRTLALPKPPKVERDAAADQENMWNYYSEVTNFDSVHSELNSLVDRHEKRMSDLDGMSQEAANVIWYPFTQHKSLKPEAISVIDSAYQDSFDMLAPRETDSALQPTFDASASWWTQGLGHGNPRLALAAAYAAGRYGHVMFASCVHEPALELARTLLRRHDNPRLARVFFSDNGSTGVEVAVKMALRSARRKQNWAEDHAIDIIGLKGSYHGDTIGAMDCAEQSAYNKQEAWYTGRGCTLSFGLL